jgi:hypothetical protein
LACINGLSQPISLIRPIKSLVSHYQMTFFLMLVDGVDGV